MEPFAARFPGIAEKETRKISVFGERLGLPLGDYFMLESYCNDKKCDCRRVFINIFYGEKTLATIGYGWENLKFYAEWLGRADPDDEMLKHTKGPALELTGVSSQYSEKLLELFTQFMLKDEVFIERLKRHYKLFKEKK